DRTAPRLRLRSLGRRSLRGRVVSVRASCDEPCALLGITRFSFSKRRARASAALKTRIGRKTLRRPGRATLRMKLTHRSYRKLRKSLRAKRRVRAQITVAGTDASGNTVRRRLKIRVRSKR
ncbi:MAG: hypothetical protein H0V29_07340, partial [Thermoleophilaceae bacterium]|nr:hypothetical protein [Thermoleophilaceae bacterium]